MHLSRVHECATAQLWAVPMSLGSSSAALVRAVLATHPAGTLALLSCTSRTSPVLPCIPRSSSAEQPSSFSIPFLSLAAQGMQAQGIQMHACTRMQGRHIQASFQASAAVPRSRMGRPACQQSSRRAASSLCATPAPSAAGSTASGNIVCVGEALFGECYGTPIESSKTLFQCAVSDSVHWPYIDQHIGSGQAPQIMAL